MQDAGRMADEILDKIRGAMRHDLTAALERCALESHKAAYVTARLSVITNSAGSIEVSASLGTAAKDIMPRCLLQFERGQLALLLVSDEDEEAA